MATSRINGEVWLRLTNSFVSKGQDPRIPYTRLRTKSYVPTEQEVSRGWYMKSGLSSTGKSVVRRIYLTKEEVVMHRQNLQRKRKAEVRRVSRKRNWLQRLARRMFA